MGYCKNITIDSFPKQGIQLGAAVEVIFNYDVTQTILGIVVRDDMEPPWETIIRLSDNRYLLASECQYTIIHAPPHNNSIVLMSSQDEALSPEGSARLPASADG